ncbi:hypothetical protein D3C87_1584040 [compost metagenome]
MICRTKSNPRARVSSLVLAPLMISTNGIFSTGLKKCRPMNLLWSGTAVARPLIGRVEVLDAITASAPTTFCAASETLAFSSRSSNTASMIRSQPARSASLSVGWMRASTVSRCSTLICPRATFLSSSAAECALPFSAAARLMSLSTTSIPADALTNAIPAPIIPAPSTPTFLVA